MSYILAQQLSTNLNISLTSIKSVTEFNSVWFVQSNNGSEYFVNKNQIQYVSEQTKLKHTINTLQTHINGLNKTNSTLFHRNRAAIALYLLTNGYATQQGFVIEACYGEDAHTILGVLLDQHKLNKKHKITITSINKAVAA